MTDFSKSMESALLKTHLYEPSEAQKKQIEEFCHDHPNLRYSINPIYDWGGRPSMINITVDMDYQLMPAASSATYTLEFIENRGYRQILEDLARELEPGNNADDLKQSFLKYSDDMRGYLTGLEKRIAALEREVVRLRGMV